MMANVKRKIRTWSGRPHKVTVRDKPRRETSEKPIWTP
jgi:hypothetical protein